jgi:hypothetical protein
MRPPHLPSLPNDVIADGIIWWDEPTKAEQAPNPARQRDKERGAGIVTPRKRRRQISIGHAIRRIVSAK